MRLSIRKLLAKHSSEKAESRSGPNILSKENTNNKKSTQDKNHRQALSDLGKDIEDDSVTIGIICTICHCKLRTNGLQPNWRWNLEPNTLLCSDCYTKKENEHERKVNFCNTCHGKLGFVRYNPKPMWKLSGQMCRKCWDSKNSSQQNRN